MKFLLIAGGGALGAVCRFAIARLINAISPAGFPWGTLGVNVIGSFLLGVIFTLMHQRGGAWAGELRLFVMIGFLGAFTTFSTFSLEVVELLQQGFIMRSLLNIIANVVLCVGLLWLGMILTRHTS